MTFSHYFILIHEKLLYFFNDLENFGRSGAQMSGSQFGGDSTIARLNNFEEMTPEDQFAEHNDNVSTFGDGGEDVANVEDVEKVLRMLNKAFQMLKKALKS